MKKLISVISADRITKISTIVALAIILATVIYTVILYPGLPPYLPIFNQLGWGDPRLGEQYLIFLPTISALAVVIANTVIAYFLYETMPLVSRVMTITSMLISTLTLLFVVRITQLVV